MNIIENDCFFVGIILRMLEQYIVYHIQLSTHLLMIAMASLSTYIDLLLIFSITMVMYTLLP